MRTSIQQALLAMNGSDPVPAGETCAACDTPMMITRDAIGRPRKRCPKCQGVSHNRRHPDEVLLPQGLVRAHAQLPEVAPGQLRCQRCARGVSPRERFCDSCRRARQARPCTRCRGSYTPSRSGQKVCDSCSRAKSAAVRLCSGCNRTAPRKKGERARVASCDFCRIPPVHLCTRCQRPIELRGGRPPKICEACLTPAELRQRISRRQLHRPSEAP